VVSTLSSRYLYRVSCHSGSPRCSLGAFRWTSCTECGIYFCMTVSCPCSSKTLPRPTGQPRRHTILDACRSCRDQLRAPSFTASGFGRNCFGTSRSPTAGMSTFSDRVARARRQREAQGRRRPETADQDGTTTQEDDASTTSERRVDRADRDDITSKDMNLCPSVYVCVCVFCEHVLYVVTLCFGPPHSQKGILPFCFFGRFVFLLLIASDDFLGRSFSFVYPFHYCFDRFFSFLTIAYPTRVPPLLYLTIHHLRNPSRYHYLM